MTAAAVSIVPGQRVPSRGIKIVWEEPPPAGHGSSTSPYTAFAAALRERPGEWAVLKEFPRTHAKRGWSLASRINQGRGADWGPTGTFEAAARSVDDVVKVYVRYRGLTEVSA